MAEPPPRRSGRKPPGDASNITISASSTPRTKRPRSASATTSARPRPVKLSTGTRAGRGENPNSKAESDNHLQPTHSRMKTCVKVLKILKASPGSPTFCHELERLWLKVAKLRRTDPDFERLYLEICKEHPNREFAQGNVTGEAVQLRAGSKSGHDHGHRSQ